MLAEFYGSQTLKFTYAQTVECRCGENIDSRDWFLCMNLREVTGGKKRKGVTAMKTVKMGTAKMHLCYIFIAVYCCGVTPVSTSAFIYWQCNGDQRINYILLKVLENHEMISGVCMELQRDCADWSWKPEYIIPVHFRRRKVEESVGISSTVFCRENTDSQTALGAFKWTSSAW